MHASLMQAKQHFLEQSGWQMFSDDEEDRYEAMQDKMRDTMRDAAECEAFENAVKEYLKECGEATAAKNRAAKLLRVGRLQPVADEVWAKRPTLSKKAVASSLNKKALGSVNSIRRVIVKPSK